MAEDGTQLLEELMRFKPDGLTANAWAVQAGVGRTIWADLRRHGNPSRRTLEKLLSVAGSSLAEFEALRVDAPSNPAAESAGLAEKGRAWGQAPLPPLPLYRSDQRGTWGEPERGIPLISIDRDLVVGRTSLPPSLAADRRAYAITVAGESMWPRFRPGRRVAVSASLPVAVGDDVLLLLAGGQGVLIGELLLRSSDGVRLRQYNPQAEFEVPAAGMEAIHKVIGELI